MALIACPECAKQISAAAGQCPHCGYSLAAVARDGSAYVTNQGTGKSLKLQGALALSLLIVSVTMFLVVAGAEADPTLWVLLTFASVAWWVVVRVLKWWRHA